MIRVALATHEVRKREGAMLANGLVGLMKNAAPFPIK